MRVQKPRGVRAGDFKGFLRHIEQNGILSKLPIAGQWVLADGERIEAAAVQADDGFLGSVGLEPRRLAEAFGR